MVNVRVGITLVLILALNCIEVVTIDAMDFPEPLRIIDPVSAPLDADVPIFPAAYSELAFNDHIFQSTAEDIWNLHVTASFTLANFSRIFALNAYYSAYTLTSPFSKSDHVVNIFRFWLGAVEIEYGVTASLDIGFCHIIMEYARTSQHPLLSGFSEVATDDLKIGVVFPTFREANFESTIFVRGATIDLFDFWQSVLPKPWLDGMITVGNESSLRLNRYLSFFANTSIDGNSMRAGGFTISFRNETGIRLGSGLPKGDIYFEYAYTPNTEELRETVTPSSLAGIGFRFSLAYP
jgi:hypothetical protein